MSKFGDLIKNKKFPLRLMLLVLILIPIIFYYDFGIHILYHFTGSILPYMITKQWYLVILNIVLFITFLIPLSFRRKINWKEYGLVTAFFVSLFIEMYGIPLTVFFASKSFTSVEIDLPNIIYEFKFLGVNIKMTLAMVYGTLLMVIGMVLILIGWVTLYKNYQPDEIVTRGIYSYSRHPQYLGFIFIIIGWVVGWPTFLTIIFAPILIFIYIRVCKVEERELSNMKDYKLYKEKVPFLI